MYNVNIDLTIDGFYELSLSKFPTTIKNTMKWDFSSGGKLCFYASPLHALSITLSKLNDTQ